MKINPMQQPNSILQAYRAGKTETKSRASFFGGTDEVTFSEQAVSFSKVFSEVKAQMEVRSPADQTRLAEIAEQVRNGTYQVDSGKVADSIIADIFGG